MYDVFVRRVWGLLTMNAYFMYANLCMCLAQIGVRFDASVGRILPFRDKYVIQDLALAILKTFVNSASIVNSIDSSAATDADVQSTDVNVDAGVHNNMQMQPRYVYSNRIRNVSAICEGVLPMFAHWNVKQHAKALIHAVDELLS